MLRYKSIWMHFFLDTFALTAKAISQRDNQYIQLFLSNTGFVYTYPMKEKTEIVHAVKTFNKEIDVPNILMLDPAGEQRSKELTNVAKVAK